MNSRNAKTVDNCYSAVLFVHMVAATFQLCFETFQVFTVSDLCFLNSLYNKKILYILNVFISKFNNNSFFLLELRYIRLIF